MFFILRKKRVEFEATIAPRFHFRVEIARKKPEILYGAPLAALFRFRFVRDSRRDRERHALLAECFSRSQRARSLLWKVREIRSHGELVQPPEAEVSPPIRFIDFMERLRDFPRTCTPSTWSSSNVVSFSSIAKAIVPPSGDLSACAASGSTRRVYKSWRDHATDLLTSSSDRAFDPWRDPRDGWDGLHGTFQGVAGARVIVTRCSDWMKHGGRVIMGLWCDNGIDP